MESLSKGLRVGTQTEKGRNKVWVLKSVTTAGPTPLGNNVIPVILNQRKGKSGGGGGSSTPNSCLLPDERSF